MNLKKIKPYLYAVLIFSMSCLLFLCLMSFNSADNSWVYYSTKNLPIKNWLGTFGAVTSGLLFYILGSTSYIIVVFLLFASYFFFKNKNFAKSIERFLAFIPFLLSSALLLENQYSMSGGILGYYFNKFLLNFVDSFLIQILSFTFFIGSFLLITHCSFVSISYSIVKVLRIFSYLVMQLKPIFLYIYNFILKLLSIFNMIFSWFASLLNQKIFEKGDPEYVHEQIDFWKEYKEPIQVEPTQLEPEILIKYPAESIYKLPNLEIFTAIKEVAEDKKIYEELQKRAKVLEDKLEKFGVYGQIKSIEFGPVVTLFEYAPNVDTKISKIIALEDDLALALEALTIRIIAPIPGKPYVGFEVANKNPRTVYFSNIVHSKEFRDFKGELPLILGQDSIGRNVIVDLFKMPHLLVAGSTGSGKSVALNAMLGSLLCKHSPDELKLILIDPKRLEFSAYQDIAHLLFPIVTHPKNSVEVLKWLVNTMEQRYEFMATKGIKNINDYHLLFSEAKTEMPYIVLVIDELADLMMTTGKDIEVLIARIAQMARAAGIHMIVATQRPSVDVITGLIKVNFPSRISFRVVSKIDSRTILDSAGAEKLLGRGDMLFLNSNASSLERIHGAYLSTREINDLVNHIKLEREPHYIELNNVTGALSTEDLKDEILVEILDFLQEVDEISISYLQRKFRIGYNRSARIMEQLENLGYILPSDGSKMRKVVKNL